jgi:hypothetical protein
MGNLISTTAIYVYSVPKAASVYGLAYDIIALPSTLRQAG